MSATHILLISACAVLDRARGAGYDKLSEFTGTAIRAAAMLSYGYTLGILIGLGEKTMALGLGYPVPDWRLFAIMWLWYIGERIGFGNAIGPALHGERPDRFALHWWQIGPLKRSAWLSLAARGALWGVPCLILYPWAHKVLALPIAAAISMPLACWMVLWFTPPLRRIDSTAGEEFIAESARSGRMWSAQELLRGALVGLFALLIAGWIK